MLEIKQFLMLSLSRQQDILKVINGLKEEVESRAPPA